MNFVSQEAVVQHEQYKQEVSHLQSLMEEAHGLIQAQPVASGNIQQLQAQIKQHEVHTHAYTHTDRQEREEPLSRSGMPVLCLSLLVPSCLCWFCAH